ncbi:MAG: hypothetical protein GF308_10745 [Candidatus Heimdallarchaeota archaeon]|nr:hypothetical protein [Candidatus Heimdallarchaeota archaeon]
MKRKKICQIGILVILSLGFVGILKTLAMPWPGYPGPTPHEFTYKGYVYDHTGSDDLSGAFVYMYDDHGNQVDNDITDSNGYYKLTHYTCDYTTYTIEVSKTYYHPQSIDVYSSGIHNYNFYLENTLADKFAIFFYASDAIEDTHIYTYRNRLRDGEGFDYTYIHKDVNDWKAKMSYIDSMENENDFIFIYLAGHGTYSNSDSIVRVNPGNDGYRGAMVTDSEPTTVDIKSSEFETEINKLESKNILVVVESCFSGGFYEDLKYKSGVQVITSSDKYNAAYFYNAVEMNIGDADEGCFSHYYFAKIYSGGSDSVAFSYARSKTLQFVDYYDFDYEQNPLRYDGTLYPWFRYW